MHPTIEQRWPLPASYADALKKARKLLDKQGVAVTAFSHYGFVVPDVRDALAWLAAHVDSAWGDVPVEWGEAFGCEISRRTEPVPGGDASGGAGGVEFEFIEPQRDSFLKAHLDAHGQGVQHLSFNVADLGAALAALAKEMIAPITPEPVYAGLHGQIAFVRPQAVTPLCVELCEPSH